MNTYRREHLTIRPDALVLGRNQIMKLILAKSEPAKPGLLTRLFALLEGV